MSQFKMPDMSTEKGMSIVKTVIVVAIIIVIIVVLVNATGGISKLFNGIEGLFGSDKATTDAEKSVSDAATSASSPDSPWSETLYNNDPQDSTLDYDTLKSMAEGIANSTTKFFGFAFFTDASQAFTQIKKCNNKIDVSNLVVVYGQLYGTDLLTDMKYYYDSSANVQVLQQIINFVNNLPAK